MRSAHFLADLTAREREREKEKHFLTQFRATIAATLTYARLNFVTFKVAKKAQREREREGEKADENVSIARILDLLRSSPTSKTIGYPISIR